MEDENTIVQRKNLKGNQTSKSLTNTLTHTHEFRQQHNKVCVVDLLCLCDFNRARTFVIVFLQEKNRKKNFFVHFK